MLEPPLPGTTIKSYIDANLGRRPIYFTVEVPELEAYYEVEQVEPQLMRISGKEP